MTLRKLCEEIVDTMKKKKISERDTDWSIVKTTNFCCCYIIPPPKNYRTLDRFKPYTYTVTDKMNNKIITNE